MPDKIEYSLYFEVRMSSEPSDENDFEYDKCPDGMYVKSVKQIGRHNLARGAIPWKEGDELPEDVIRRMRDA